MLQTVCFPQTDKQLGRHQLASVLGDQPKDEEPVASQVGVGEALDVDRVLIDEPDRGEMASNAAVLRRPVGKLAKPGDETARRDCRDETQPEPDQNEDLLVEEVDREHALNGVAMYVGVLADAIVAHGNARESVAVATSSHLVIESATKLFLNYEDIDGIRL